MNKLLYAFSLLFTACATLGASSCDTVRQAFDAEIWTVRPATNSIGRTVTDPDTGEVYREAVKCDDPSAAVFICMHKDDKIRWEQEFLQRCN